MSKQARVRLTRGKTELLLWMDIAKKLGTIVNIGINRITDGQSGWGMMTFSENRHLAFPLVPTACDYAKLGEFRGITRGGK